MAEACSHDILVIGASAGGVEALTTLVRDLPAELPAAVFVVVHITPHATSVLPKILSRHGKVPAAHAQDGEAIQHGRIYIAPPDFHLLVENGFVRVVRGPKENDVRPAVDPLFRTAARAYGSRVIGVVLTGLLSDGSAGLMAIKTRSGIAVVQDPDDALFPDMPRHAMEYTKVDYVMPLSDLAPLLVRLTREPVAVETVPISTNMEKESAIAEMDMATIENENKPGTPSVFGCPECGGTLWELQENEMFRFRCRVGHAYSADNLLAAQATALEDAMWSALRALEENSALARRLEKRAHERKHNLSAKNFAQRAQTAEYKAELIRQALLKGEPEIAHEKSEVS